MLLLTGLPKNCEKHPCDISLWVSLTTLIKPNNYYWCLSPTNNAAISAILFALKALPNNLSEL
jgi:hypothetical protein